VYLEEALAPPQTAVSPATQAAPVHETPPAQ